MSVVAGVAAQPVVEESIQEARAVLASVISQIMVFFRRLMEYVLNFAQQFWTWAGQHPLACICMVVNFTIWSSV
ncbi:MAG: hypothetical protein B6U97_03475 [Candidatus Altiarchaeales archaeon ex4484_96]|nr:MAG: hypothetical protein B6U97_03475 [Candidatus Altiarchaeales archaeon ex4484_96]